MNARVQHERTCSAATHALAEIESRFEGGDNATPPPDSGQLLALVDALCAGTLNDGQRETIQALRAGILVTFAPLSAGLAEQETTTPAVVW